MKASGRIGACVIVCGSIAITTAWCSGPAAGLDREAEIKRLGLLVQKVQPAVAALTGIPEGAPVAVDAMTRTELEQFIVRELETQYPDDELLHRGRCLAMIGLLPKGYDLEAGLTDLVREQAGGLYDPRAKTFNGMLDLSPELRRPAAQGLIVSHELAHALQDRVVDIVSQLEATLENQDYEYAFRATIEGMATLVMVAYSQNLKLDDVPDTRPTMRLGWAQRAGSDPSMKAYAQSPPYIKELLIGPYAEGGAFIQAWRKANPGAEMAALLKRLPVSSEQILHPEKYTDWDEPTPIDLSGVAGVLPAGWSLTDDNTLGEFDLLTLFSIHAGKSDDPAKMAAGWDGLRFEAYSDTSGNLMMIGSSVWDSEQDAEEFRAGFSKVLGGVAGPQRFTVARDRNTVDFVIGSVEDSIRQRILETL